MTNNAIRLAVVALIVGVLGGAIAAIAIPRTSAQGPAPLREPVRVAAATPEPKSISLVQLRRTGPITVEARTPDPDGGPQWVVRSFLANRMTERDGKLRVISRARCVQLGRVHRGTFGWIDDRGTFRPATISVVGAPIDCGSRTADLRREPHFSAFRRLVTPPGGGTPRLGRTVAWGYAGAAARRVEVRTAGGRAVGGSSGPSNAVLHVIDDQADSSRMTMTVAYASGKPVVRGGSWTGRLEGAGRGRKYRADYGQRSIVAARAADPSGGLPYGIVALPAVGGGWCVNSRPGRIVEDRVGHVDFALGTISEEQVSGLDCQSGRYMSRKRPIGGGSGGGTGTGEPSDDPGYGRVARRTMPGVTYYAGPVLPDVRTITVKSPRDVRTVVPSSPAHAYLVVYDGMFTAGEMRMTSTFGDGTSTTSAFAAGF